MLGVIVLGAIMQIVSMPGVIMLSIVLPECNNVPGK
jgi:hypothetical protein